MRKSPAPQSYVEETTYYIQVNEQQALDIASGYVPNVVKAQVLTLLDWVAEDERRANRPSAKKKAR